MKHNEFKNIQGILCSKIDFLYNTLVYAIPQVNVEELHRCKDLVKSASFESKTLKLMVAAISFDIPFTTIRHLQINREMDIDNIRLQLGFDGTIDATLWKKEEENPWVKSSFKAELMILTMQGKRYSKGFHIDYSANMETTYQEVHPSSHMHFNFIVNDDISSTEDKFSIDVPRLVHYPLDLVLGISLVLQNYAPELYQKLANNHQYLSLSYESQRRIIKPYFNNFINCIDSKGKSNVNIKKVCPYLL